MNLCFGPEGTPASTEPLIMALLGIEAPDHETSVNLVSYAVAWLTSYAVACLVLILTRQKPQGNTLSEVANRIYAVLTISLGYFLYDTAVCFILDRDPWNAAHHLCTILGLLVGVCNRMEVSNPFLHLRFILRALRKGNQQLMLVNDAAFALSFFVCRLLVGPFVVWATVASPTTPWIVKLGGVGIFVVSLFWASKILRMIQRTVLGGSKKRT
eukprot:jgi/Astpho2/5987/Aster-x1341